jgi:hypothetical protein
MGVCVVGNGVRLTEDQHAAARIAERELDRGEATGCVVGVRAPRADGVQVQGQREPAARHGDRLGQLEQRIGTLSGTAVCRRARARARVRVLGVLGVLGVFEGEYSPSRR